jgi:hypothetical protein
MTAENHVDGEIVVPVGPSLEEALANLRPAIPAPHTEIDIRAVALQQAVLAGGGKANREWILGVAKGFEDYLRNGVRS